MMNQQQQQQIMMNQQQQHLNNNSAQQVNFSNTSTPDKNAYGNAYDDDYGTPESKGEDDAPYVSQREFEWNVAFSRLMFLNDLNRTLDFLLLNEPMFEAAELYASSSTNENENMKQGFNSIINLLRAQALYKQNANNYEPFVLALEDVFGITVTDDVSTYLGKYETNIMQFKSNVILNFLPEFILSSDFYAYWELSNNLTTGVKIGTPEWFSKFTQIVNGYKYAMSLFFIADGRHAANIKMREQFGDFQDVQQFIDVSTGASNINDIIMSLKSGKDCMAKVMTNNIQRQQLPGLVCVKGLREAVDDQKVIYTLLTYTQGHDDEVYKQLLYVLRAMP